MRSSSTLRMRFPLAEKPKALASATLLLRDLDFAAKHVSVRINSIGSGLARAELEALAACPRLDAVIVPKAETEDDIRRVEGILNSKRAAGCGAVAVELLIETAAGLMRVDHLAAHPAVTALHLGSAILPRPSVRAAPRLDRPPRPTSTFGARAMASLRHRLISSPTR